METKKKKLLYDIAIGLGLILYICLTTLIFVNHKKIVQLKKQIKSTTSNNLSKNTTSKKQRNLSAQRKQEIENLEKNVNDTAGHFKLGVHFMGKTGSEGKAIKHFEELLQIDPENKNKSNIKKWLIILKKRYKKNQSQLMTNLQNLTKFIKENPHHYSLGLKKKQIEIIKTQLERNDNK